MEFLEGETLAARLARTGRFAPDYRAAAAIAGEVAGAFVFTHAKEIIHRDLKPENLFLARGEAAAGEPLTVKILDFGIAKLMRPEKDATSTRTGTLMGTPPYMSPEQSRGAVTIDHRSDVYSLGCVFFETITGRTPFVRELPGDYLSAHIAERPPRLTDVDPAAPAALDELLGQMLEKDPAARMASMAEVVARLEAFLGVERAKFRTLLPLVVGPRVSAPRPAHSPNHEKTGDAATEMAAPAPGAGSTAVLPGGAADAPASATTFTRGVGERRRLSGSRSPGRTAIGVAAVLAIAGAAVGWRLSTRPAHRDAPVRVAGPDGSLTNPNPTPTPNPNPGAGPIAPEKPAGTARPTETNTTVAAPAETVEIAIMNAPRGVRAKEGERDLDVAPLTLPADGAIHAVRFSAAGFRPLVLQVRATAGERISLQGMEREAAREIRRDPAAPARTTLPAGRPRANTLIQNEDIIQ